MKRLYNCQARYDKNGLVSYKTRIINIEHYLQDDNTLLYTVSMFNYRTTTTLSHIRKYIRILKETYQYELANKVQRLYDYANKHKNQIMIYMTVNGVIQE